MADEVTLTTANDLTYVAMILQENIIDALYAHNNVGGLLRYKSIAGMPSKAASFPSPPKLAAAAKGEVEDLANTAFATTEVTLTAGQVGVMIEPSDLLDVSDIVDMSFYGQQLGWAVAEKFVTDALAEAAGFTTQCGATTVNLTEANILTGIAFLEASSTPGPYKGALHPQQKMDLVSDIGTTITGAATQGGSIASATREGGAVPDGMLGNFYGIDWIINAAVPTATAGADRLGMIVSPMRGVGWVEKWPIRMELERNASKRSTEIVCTACYGVGELDATYGGVGVLTDA